MKIANNVLDLIGNTPLIKINSFSQNAQIYAKCEFLNPAHSIKDRVAFNMIKKAFDKGIINQNTHIIEPTSGNTGVGLAMVCAKFDLKLTLTMPESMSIERRNLLKAFGANLVLTSAKDGMQGSVDKAKKMCESEKNTFMPSQFDNEANTDIHTKTTAIEILNSLDKVDIFVCGFGTGGSLSGIAKVLKEKNPNTKIVALEPKNSPLLSKGVAGAHKIQGIGANFIPKNLNTSIIDEIITISDEDAISSTKQLAQKEGILVGISSGANVFGASLLANRDENKDKIIVTLLPDTGERYLSMGIYD